MKKESLRVYNMPDADLCMFTSNLLGTMTRDATEFAAKGVDAGAISALETLGDAFEVFPNDAFYKNDITATVEIKNAKRESCQVQARAIIGCAKIKWGTNSAQVKRFAAGKMTSESDRSFLTLARQCVTLATEYLSDLTAIGLTQAMIDDLEDDIQLVEDYLNTIALKESQRDIKTQERIDDGNEIYSYVVRYCEIGKIIWQDVDEAKYNDYVIYPTVHSGLSKPQNLSATYDILNPPDITLSWDDVDDATSYNVYYDIVNIGSTAGDYSLLGNYSSSPIAVAGVVNKRFWFKIKAINATQTSSYSNEVYADVPVS